MSPKKNSIAMRKPKKKKKQEKTISFVNGLDHNNSTGQQLIYGNILCRSCGNDISSPHFIFSKSSSALLYSFNDTLFERNDVLVQVLQSNIFFQFPVITFTNSTCLGVDEWEENNSWFSGYRWRACLCPDCGAFVGWVFEPVDQNLDVFFGLVLTSLIGESCKYLIF